MVRISRNILQNLSIHLADSQTNAYDNNHWKHGCKQWILMGIDFLMGWYWKIERHSSTSVFQHLAAFDNRIASTWAEYTISTIHAYWEDKQRSVSCLISMWICPGHPRKWWKEKTWKKRSGFTIYWESILLYYSKDDWDRVSAYWENHRNIIRKNGNRDKNKRTLH